MQSSLTEGEECTEANTFKEIKSKGLSDWSHVHYESGSKDGANISGVGCCVKKVDAGPRRMG